MDRAGKIAENWSRVLERTADAARRAGRNPEEIAVVAVSKGRVWEDVSPLLTAGCRLLAENRVQEAQKKYEGRPRNFELHMVGRLQKNKVKHVAGLFDAVQSVDSVELAEALQSALEKTGGTVKAFAQVNAHRDPAKSGFYPESLEAAVDRISQLPNVRLEGMMAIAPLTRDLEVTRSFFRDTRRLFEACRTRCPALRTLSMGMTDDFEIAVEEGADMVRIGRAVFETGREA